MNRLICASFALIVTSNLACSGSRTAETTNSTASASSSTLASTNCFEGFPQFEVRGASDDCQDPQRPVGLIHDQLNVIVPPQTYLLLVCVTSLPVTSADLEGPCQDLALELGTAELDAQDAALCHQGASTNLGFTVDDDTIETTLRRLQVDRLVAAFEVMGADRSALDEEAALLSDGNKITEPLETIDRYLAACAVA